MEAMEASPVDLVPLGGLGEIGLNCLLLECGGKILVVDCGLMFPEEEHLGVDCVIPDFAHLEGRGADVLGVVLTHGHEDHVGALPWFLQRFPVPVHGTTFTLALVREKLDEFDLPRTPRLEPVRPGEPFTVGPFRIEPFAVAHSIPGGVGLAIETPAGLIVHAGDLKLDPAPIDGRRTDLARLAELGERGVLALLLDSTNAERPGRVPSESSLAPAFRDLVADAPGRVIVATFASHVHRVQQVADAAAACGRRLHLAGRSVVSVAATAMQLGELRIPSPLLVDAGGLRELAPERTVVLTTGSQGEPLAALSRIAHDDHRQIAVGPGDRVAISARVIPGHERAVARTVNRLVRRGAEVRYGRDAGIHVSGHAAADELAEVVRAARPRHLVPVHGEPRHLVALARIAAAAGVPGAGIVVAADGDRLRCEAGRVTRAGVVPAGRTLVDGTGQGGPQDAVLKDRRRIAQDGFVLVLVGISRQSGELVAGPEVLTRGVAFAGEEAPLLEEARETVAGVLASCGPELRTDWSETQARLHAALRRLVNRRMERRPLILPTVIEI